MFDPSPAKHAQKTKEVSNFKDVHWFSLFICEFRAGVNKAKTHVLLGWKSWFGEIHHKKSSTNRGAVMKIIRSVMICLFQNRWGHHLCFTEQPKDGPQVVPSSAWVEERRSKGDGGLAFGMLVTGYKSLVFMLFMVRLNENWWLLNYVWWSFIIIMTRMRMRIDFLIIRDYS